MALKFVVCDKILQIMVNPFMCKAILCQHIKNSTMSKIEKKQQLCIEKYDVAYNWIEV